MQIRRGRSPSGGPRQVPEKTQVGRGQCRGSELLGNSTVNMPGLLPSQDRDPIIPSTRKPVSPPGRGQGCQLGTGVNKSFSHLSSCLTFIPESPGRPGSPTAPGGPCKKKPLFSPGATACPERVKIVLRSHNRELQKRGQAFESWQNYGVGCKLAELGYPAAGPSACP